MLCTVEGGKRRGRRAVAVPQLPGESLVGTGLENPGSSMSFCIWKKSKQARRRYFAVR